MQVKPGAAGAAAGPAAGGSRETLKGNLRAAVQLPPGEDRNEWLAVNTVDFFNQINLLYGSITEFCTDATCPIM